MPSPQENEYRYPTGHLRFVIKQTDDEQQRILQQKFSITTRNGKNSEIRIEWIDVPLVKE